MSFDLDNEEFKSADAKSGINEAGIHHNIAYRGVNMTSFDAKDNSGKKFIAAEFVFVERIRDEKGNITDGRQHKELYFKPETDPANVQYTPDKWEDDGKGGKVKGSKFTEEETVKLLKVDFARFLLDLSSALGYNAETFKQGLKSLKDDSFESAIDFFKKQCPPSDKTLISMKLLWDNNKKKKSSFIKLRVGPVIYYPWNKKIFDVYKPDRPTTLFMSDYEQTNNGKRMFTQADSAPAAAAGATASGTAPSTRQRYTEPASGGGSAEAPTSPTNPAGKDNPDDWI